MMKAWADYSSDDVNPSPDTTFSSSGVSTTLRPPSCALSRHVLCFPNAGNRAAPASHLISFRQGKHLIHSLPTPFFNTRLDIPTNR